MRCPGGTTHERVDKAAALERALLRASRDREALLLPAQSGVRVLRVDVERLAPESQRITIDLSQRALTCETGGDIERLVDQLLASAAAATAGAGHLEYRFNQTHDEPPDQEPHIDPSSEASGRSCTPSS